MAIPIHLSRLVLRVATEPAPIPIQVSRLVARFAHDEIPPIQLSRVVLRTAHGESIHALTPLSGQMYPRGGFKVGVVPPGGEVIIPIDAALIRGQPVENLVPSDGDILRYNTTLGIWQLVTGTTPGPHTHPFTDITGLLSSTQHGDLSTVDTAQPRHHWNQITNKPASLPPEAHALVGALHTASGLTAGHFLKATSATAFAFQAHGLTATDVGAAATGHTHAFADITAKPTTLAGYGITDAAALVHTHDDRYYTETETNGLLAGKSDTTHNHDATYSLLGHTHSGLAPVGGTTGQVLKKVSNTNYDYSWQADDVGGASAPIASSTVTGTVKTTDNDADPVVYRSAVVDTLLAGKSNTGHSHAIADVTGLQAALDSKSAVGHSHIIADVTGLQAALDSKSDTSHTHAFGVITGTISSAQHGDLSTVDTAVARHHWNQITNKPTTFAPAAHTHPFTELTFSGLTIGQVWRATSTTAAAFGALDLANANAVTGILADARLSSNIARLDTAQTWTAAQTFSGAPTTFMMSLAIEAASDATSPRIQSYASRTLFINQLGNPVSIGTGGLSVNGVVDSVEYRLNNLAVLGHVTNYTRLRDALAGSGGLYIGSTVDPGNYYDNTEHYFRTRAGVEYARISSAGHFGIGVTPAQRLHVQTSAAGVWTTQFRNTNNGAATYLAHGDGYGAFIHTGTGASASTYALSVQTPGVDALYVRGDAITILGHNVPVSGAERLQVYGGIRTDSVVCNFGGGVNINGHLKFTTDATYDIGASGANRPRDIFLSRDLIAGGRGLFGGSGTTDVGAGGIGVVGASRFDGTITTTSANGIIINNAARVTASVGVSGAITRFSIDSQSATDTILHARYLLNNALFGVFEFISSAFRLKVGSASTSRMDVPDTGTALLVGNWGMNASTIFITAATVAGNAGFRLPHGTAPSSPTNGDMWSTTAGLFIRIDGVTKTVTLT